MTADQRLSQGPRLINPRRPGFTRPTREQWAVGQASRELFDASASAVIDLHKRMITPEELKAIPQADAGAPVLDIVINKKECGGEQVLGTNGVIWQEYDEMIQDEINTAWLEHDTVPFQFDPREDAKQLADWSVAPDDLVGIDADPELTAINAIPEQGLVELSDLIAQGEEGLANTDLIVLGPDTLIREPEEDDLELMAPAFAGYGQTKATKAEFAV